LCASQQSYHGQLVILALSICRRAECIDLFASLLDAGIHLQPWFLHHIGRLANQARNVSLCRS